MNGNVFKIDILNGSGVLPIFSEYALKKNLSGARAKILARGNSFFMYIPKINEASMKTFFYRTTFGLLIPYLEILSLKLYPRDSGFLDICSDTNLNLSYLVTTIITTIIVVPTSVSTTTIT